MSDSLKDILNEDKEKARIRRRNYIAKDLLRPKYHQRVVKVKTPRLARITPRNWERFED